MCQKHRIISLLFVIAIAGYHGLSLAENAERKDKVSVIINNLLTAKDHMPFLKYEYKTEDISKDYKRKGFSSKGC